MPDRNHWSEDTADGVLLDELDGTTQMYVTKGDTWVVTIRLEDNTLEQLTFEQARARWNRRVKQGWRILRQSRPWKSLMRNGQ